MSEKSKRARRSFSDEFKQDAVDLVVKQGYSFKAAADAVGVAAKSLRDWHEKLAPEPEPCDDDASYASRRRDACGRADLRRGKGGVHRKPPAGVFCKCFGPNSSV